MGMQYKPGRYHCRITNQGFGKTQAGDDQFWLTFDVVGEINPADPDGDLLPAMVGERTAYMTLKTEKNAEFFVKDMKRLGCPMTSFGMLDTGHPNFHSFSGVEAEFTCEENNYKGKQSERWNLARESSGPVAVPLDQKEARRLDSLFGAALRGAAPDKPKRSAPPKSNGRDPNAELQEEARQTSDIPF